MKIEQQIGVRETTTLPGWDGSGKPAILSNPKWYQGGVYVPVPPAD